MRNRIKDKDFYRQQMDISEVLDKYDVSSVDSLFKRTAPIAIEIGFGNGEFLEDHYKNFPHYNYIGIETSDKFSVKTMKRLHDNNCENVSIWNTEAFSAIQKYVSDRSITRMYVNFSDPWPKKRHHKRRLIRAEFLDECYRVIKDNGFLFIVTDHEDYGLFINSLLKKHNKFRSIYDSLYVHRLDNYFQTKYERIMRAEMHDIYYFVLQKKHL